MTDDTAPEVVASWWLKYAVYAAIGLRWIGVISLDRYERVVCWLLIKGMKARVLPKD